MAVMQGTAQPPALRLAMNKAAFSVIDIPCDTPQDKA